MIALALLLAAPAEDLQARLRHLEAAAAAWAPAPSPDGTRVAYLTTLFGTRQAASVATAGGYPVQLTDEPEGANEVRYLPARREAAGRGRVARRPPAAPPGRRRRARSAVPLDADAGEQLLGGFARDGKRIFYAVQSGRKGVAANLLSGHRQERRGDGSASGRRDTRPRPARCPLRRGAGGARRARPARRRTGARSSRWCGGQGPSRSCWSISGPRARWC